jgi:hypothetical protein
MSKAFQRRLERAAQSIAKLPPRVYMDAENREWAEQIIAEIMQEHNLSRDEALEVMREIAEWLEVK